FSVRPQIAMFAPSPANNPAVARPMPRLPPVTTATLPSSRPISGAASRHVTVMRLSMHAAADCIDGDDVSRTHTCEVDFKSVTLDQPCRLLLWLDEAELEQQILVLTKRRNAVERFWICPRHVLNLTAL